MPRYNPKADHPDGACYYGSKLKQSDFGDGTSNTIGVVETAENQFARWTVGAETLLVGLPPTVTYQQYMRYYAPTGFKGKFDDQGGTKALKTYLNWDYSDPNEGAYPHPTPLQGIGPLPATDNKTLGVYGPGSRHAGVTNHLMMDGSAQAVSNAIDAAMYMFLITRNGSDPADPSP